LNQLARHLPQFVFLDLAAGGHREFIDKEDVPGNFEPGDLSPTEIDHILRNIYLTC